MSFITKLKTVFGGQKTKENHQNDDHIDSIINDIEHKPFAISDTNVLYAGLNELGGYYFFQSVIVGTFKVKSKQGATLFIEGNDFNLELASDMLEFESDHSNIQGRLITKIDFQIEESDAAKMDRSNLKQLRLSCKNHDITFSMYELSDEEE